MMNNIAVLMNFQHLCLGGFRDGNHLTFEALPILRGHKILGHKVKMKPQSIFPG